MRSVFTASRTAVFKGKSALLTKNLYHISSILVNENSRLDGIYFADCELEIALKNPTITLLASNLFSN